MIFDTTTSEVARNKDLREIRMLREGCEKEMKFKMDRFIYNCWMRRLEMINGVFTLKLLVVIQKAMTVYHEK